MNKNYHLPLVLSIFAFFVVLLALGFFSQSLQQAQVTQVISSQPASPVHESSKLNHLDHNNLPPEAKWDSQVNHAYVGGRLLVKLKSGTSEQAKGNILAAQNAHEDRLSYSSLLDKIGVTVLKLPAEASETAVAKVLEHNPNVEFAELDYLSDAAALVPNDTMYSQEWHLQKMQVPQAWDITTANTNPPIVIAIADAAGVDCTHPDLAANCIPGWNIILNNDDTSPTGSHGTEMAGSAAAVTNNGIGVAAPAGWHSKIMPIKMAGSIPPAFCSTSLASASLIAAADHGAQLISISCGASNSETQFSAAQYFYDHGGKLAITYTSDSANNNPATGYYPMRAASFGNPYILTSIATDINDAVWSGSDVGLIVDLAVPGVGILQPTTGGGYGAGTGVSPTPHEVVGVAALVLAINPNLTWHQLRSIILQSTDDLLTPGYDYPTGMGRLNALKAVQLAQAVTSGQPIDVISPTIAISGITPGQTYSGIVPVTVTASDDIGLSGLIYLVGTHEQSHWVSSPASPLTFNLDTSALSQYSSTGDWTLNAVVRDRSGNPANAQVTFRLASWDTQPPTVHITSPINGTTVPQGIVTIAADVADDMAVAVASFYIDGRYSGYYDTTAPYTYDWDTSTLAPGSHTITVYGFDSANHQASDTITVTVGGGDTTPPVATITSPLNTTPPTTVLGTIPIDTTATDNIAVTRVDVWKNNAFWFTYPATPYSLNWNTSSFPNGPYTLQAKASDATGNVGTSPIVNITVNNPTSGDTTPPTTSITQINGAPPVNGQTVSGTITINANASDNIAVTKVEFYNDGVLITNPTNCTDTTSPYSCSWNTTSTGNGNHLLTTKASDAAGNTTTSAPITVNVQNVTQTTPSFISYSATATTTNSAMINWITNIPTTGTIYYGTNKNSITSTLVDPATARTNHSLVLSNLTSNRNYSFYIRATAGTVSVYSGTGSFRTLR